jgi:hypothetical protein
MSFPYQQRDTYPTSQLIRDVRRAVIHEYRYGSYPAEMPEEVANYLVDGGLVNALNDLEMALATLEQRGTPIANRPRLPLPHLLAL